MTDQQTLLRLATRCRRMAALCATESIARKFEALAVDYEEHARLVARSGMVARRENTLGGTAPKDQTSSGSTATRPSQG